MTFENKFRNIVGRADKLEKNELVILLRELLNQLNEEKKVNIKSWKGKSSFEYKFIGDKIIVTKFQKPEKGAEPKEMKYELDKNEYYQLRQIIDYDFKHNNVDKIKSTVLAEEFYNDFWKNIFNNRRRHNHFTLMLNVMEKEGDIEYRGGYIHRK